MPLDNKTAIVTGGARGIGHAIVNKLAQLGCSVYIIDQSYPDNFNNPDENKIKTFTGDITNSDNISKLIQQIMLEKGRIDILVNNAGIIRDNVIWKMSEEEFDEVIKVNLKGSWLMCKEIASIMREQKAGRIINISSRAWLGNPGQSNYSASKGGLVSLTKVLALELASKNITVNAVAPGLIETPMTDSLPAEVFEKLLKKQPSGKAGKPEDIASAVAYLASDEASFINGQIIHVDGGRSIGSTI